MRTTEKTFLHIVLRRGPQKGALFFISLTFTIIASKKNKILRIRPSFFSIRFILTEKGNNVQFLYSFVSFQKNMFYFVKIQIKDFCIVDFS